jgi:hypothetical protein
MFGTFAAERPNEKIVYGTDKCCFNAKHNLAGLITPVHSYNLIWLQFCEFKHYLWDKPRQMPTWFDSIRSVFMPPSWQPGTADELCSKRHVRQSF